MGKRGAKLKLDEVVAEKILSALRHGAHRSTAAAFSGITDRTLREWVALGKADPESVYGKFFRSVREAETAAEIDVGKVAWTGAAMDPEYALKYLSVRWRKRWNPKTQVELAGKDGGPLQVSVVINRNPTKE